MVRQTASLIVLEILGGLILLVLVVAAIFAFRLASGPIELVFLRDQIEDSLTASRDGREVDLGELYLEWSSADRRVKLTARNMTLFDDEGQIGSQADTAEIILSGQSLVLGTIEVLRVNLQDGWVTARQLSETKWEVAGEPLPEIPAGVLPQTAQEWLERSNQVLPVALEVLEQSADRFSLEELSFDAFEIRIFGVEDAFAVVLPDAEGQIRSLEDGLSLSFASSGDGIGLPAGIGIKMASRENFTALTTEIAFVDLPLGEVVPQLGARELADPDLAIDLEFVLEYAVSDGVSEVALSAELEEGEILVANNAWPLKDLTLNGIYTADNDEFAVSVNGRQWGPFGGDVVFTLQDAVKGTGERGYRIEGEVLQMDFTPRFELPFEIQDIAAQGFVDFGQRLIRQTEVSVQSGDVGIAAEIDLQLTPERTPEDLPFIGVIQVMTEGDLDKNTVLAFWPVTLGRGARNFLIEKLEAESISNIQGRLDLKRDSLAEGFLRDEDLNLTFEVAGASVEFLSDLPRVTEASGKGRLTGNSFRILVDSGRLDDWVIDEGLFDFPKFNPKGEDFRVFARGHGPATNIMRMLANSRLRLDFDPDRLQGEGEMTFELFRPSLDKVAMEDVRFSATGTIRNASLLNAALGLNLSEGSARVDVDQDGLTVSGFGSLGPSPVQFTWRDGFNNDDAPSVLSASAIVNNDVLNRYGITGRSYLTGEIPLEVQALLLGERVGVADVSMDLTDARVDIAEIGWRKPKGTPAKSSLRYQAVEEGFSTDIQLSSDDAYLDGTFTLGEGFRLVSAELRRAFLQDRADVEGNISRDQSGGLNIALSGTYLDLSGALPGMGALRDGTGSNLIPMSVDATFDTLTLRPELHMRDAKVALSSTDKGIAFFSAEGKADDGSDLKAQFEGPAGGEPIIRVSSANAGFFANALLDADFIEGGNLELEGVLSESGQPSTMRIIVRDGRLQNAPFLTQILSLASLRGLADTLGGEGVLFSRIEVPLVIAGDKYIIEGAKAQGPALGLTANGFFEADDGAISFDGVLVPSFGMNSALGQVPIIGDLVVGRDGEGIFSLTYSVRGSLEKASVSVNPLSALAPGVIRRIFENPTTTSIPEATPRAEDNPIPSELPPIPEEEF